jgi:molybdate transport system regulatory protein
LRMKCKLWLEDHEGNLIMGEGLEVLLLGIDREGSISRAAADASISYRHAWDKIKKAEKRWGFELIRKYAGGSGGGGSHLTEQGKMLLAAFRTFHTEAEEVLNATFTHCFAVLLQKNQFTQETGVEKHDQKAL